MNRINNEYISSFIEEMIIDKDFLELRRYAEVENVPIMKLETKEFLKSLLAIKKTKVNIRNRNCYWLFFFGI